MGEHPDAAEEPWWAQAQTDAPPGAVPAPPPSSSVAGFAPPPLDATGPTAADFTPQRMLKERKRPPGTGWRRSLYRVSGGLVNAGPSRAELEADALRERARAPIPLSRRVAVISRKGGVGKTTTTLMLGHLYAAIRGDRVVAVDGNPDAGTLGYRVRRETSATIGDLLRDADTLRAYADVRRYTSQAPSRLEVLASDDDPHLTRGLGAAEIQAAVEVLERHYNLILLDTGTGVLDSATRGILDISDQLVVVLSPSLDVARAASLTLDWLNEQGYRDLVTDAVAVLNSNRDLERVEIDRVEGHFAQRCRAVARIPWDPHLEAGAVSNPEALDAETEDAYLRLAAIVADGFLLPSRRRAGPPA